MKNAADTKLRGMLEYCEGSFAFSDFPGNSASSTIDALSTVTLEGKMAKILAWYENERDDNCCVEDLAVLMFRREH